jgi:YceI-like domain
MVPAMRLRNILFVPAIICLASLAYCGANSDPPAPSQIFPGSELFKVDRAEGDARIFELTASQVDLRGYTSIGPWSSGSSDASAQVVLFTDDQQLRNLLEKFNAGDITTEQLSLPMTRSPIAQIAVPIASLHGSSDGMDRDMRAALKASKFPAIRFELLKVIDFQIQRDPRTRNPVLVLHATGNLTVAGVQRTLATDVTIQPAPGRDYIANARIEMRMTDFGVTPPTALFGLIRAHDSVSVLFNLHFVEAKPPVAQASPHPQRQ